MVNMLPSVSKEFKRFAKNCNTLKRILSDTQIALKNISANLELANEIKENVLNTEFIDSLQNILNSTPVLLIFGQSCHGKALLANILLDQIILPLCSSRWRWVKFVYGQTKAIHLTLGHEFEIVEKLKAYEKPWITVPEEDLQRGSGECPLNHCPALEIELCHPVLKENIPIMIPPDCSLEFLQEILTKNLENFLPVMLYAIVDDLLTDSNIQEIRKLKEIYQDLPILFVSVSSSEVTFNTESLTESQQHHVEYKDANKTHTLQDQLNRLGYLNDSDQQVLNSKKQSICFECSLGNKLICDNQIDEYFIFFLKDVLKSYLLKMSKLLSEIHNKCLRSFILCAFDMAREISITPRRIGYALNEEMKLYKTLMQITCEKQEEITKIIQKILQDMRSNVAEVLEGYHVQENIYHQQSVKLVTMEIQQIVLKRLSNLVAEELIQSVGCLQENFTGTLQRCLESLEKNCQEYEGNLRASDAVKQIVSAAYNIDLKSTTSFSVVHTFMDRLRKLIQNIQLPWSSCSQPRFTLEWQLQVVTDMIDSLNYLKLAKTICVQFQEHVRSSHDAFQSAMRSLENQLSGQLEHTEEQRITLRKRHVPLFAKLALESTSLCDVIRFGMPKSIKEIGRGQYGVVFSCEPWGGVNPCAFKSVVPPDDRHWNDLAMEFYYTRTIPEHPRIVKLRGSVIDHSYGGGSSPAVLLIMERVSRDLYCGLRDGLTWVSRLQIAIDVVEGIRYLHSQGLVHRDIKLKNVLLDNEDRAKISDFGFCIPEAMMSGSVVGTPVHMAPELLTGRYDSSVDVYAFGILFWYICAGHVSMPKHFVNFRYKDQLFNSVKKGIRPECLPHFNQTCWNLMEQCWSAEPSERPLLGHVQPQLESIMATARAENSPGKCSSSSSSPPQFSRFQHDANDDSYVDYIHIREY